MRSFVIAICLLISSLHPLQSSVQAEEEAVKADCPPSIGQYWKELSTKLTPMS